MDDIIKSLLVDIQKIDPSSTETQVKELVNTTQELVLPPLMMAN